MSDNQYMVYVHTNKINNKKYVGMTKHGTARWGHNGIHYIHSFCRAFRSAVLKYGWDAFDHEILHSDLSKEDACRLEKHYIAKFKTNIYRWGNKYGYNLTDGGEGTSCSYDRRGENNPLFGKHHTEEAKEKISAAKIGRYSGKDNHSYGVAVSTDTKNEISKSLKKWFKDNPCPNKRPVYCITDNLWFDSVRQASKYYGIAESCISGCCNGYAQTASGKQFTRNLDGTLPDYKGSYETVHKQSKKKPGCPQRVVCCETGQVFESLNDAAKYAGLKCSNGIRRCCLDGRRMSGGFHWNYA